MHFYPDPKSGGKSVEIRGGFSIILTDAGDSSRNLSSSNGFSGLALGDISLGKKGKII